MTFPQEILLTVSVVWLLSGLLWRRWQVTVPPAEQMTRLRTVSVFCGVLLLLGFVVLPSVAIRPNPLEGALYAVNVPFLAFSELYPPLWLVVLASLLCFAGVALSHLGDVRVLSLTMLLASALVFAVGAGWWLEPLAFMPATVSRGAVAWCMAVGVLLVWLGSRRAVQKETVFVIWALLLSGWLGLGLTAPGADVQLPALTGYYTWLEPATSQASQTMTRKHLAYGGWLLVAASALSLSVAVAAATLSHAMSHSAGHAMSQSATLVSSTKTPSTRTLPKASAQADSVQADFATQEQVWLEGTSWALFALLFAVALRYVITLDATLAIGLTAGDVLQLDLREQAVDRLLNWRTWLRIVPPYTLQTWLVATLQTAAVVVVVRTLGRLLQALVMYAGRVFRRVIGEGVKVLRVLLLVGFVVAGWLEWQPAAAVWLLALAAMCDANMQPTVVRSVLLGVLLGQGLGGLIGGSLQAGSGLGLLVVAAAIWGVMGVGATLETHLAKRLS